MWYILLFFFFASSPFVWLLQGGRFWLGDLQQHPHGVELMVRGFNLGELDQSDSQRPDISLVVIWSIFHCLTHYHFWGHPEKNIRLISFWYHTDTSVVFTTVLNSDRKWLSDDYCRGKRSISPLFHSLPCLCQYQTHFFGQCMFADNLQNGFHNLELSVFLWTLLISAFKGKLIHQNCLQYSFWN